jgi:hypothetical protein
MHFNDRRPDPELDAMIEAHRNKWTALPGDFGSAEGQRIPHDYIKSQLQADASSVRDGRIFIRNTNSPGYMEQHYDYVNMLAHHVAGPDPERRAAIKPPKVIRGDYGPVLESKVTNPQGEEVRIHVFPAR